MSIFFHHPLLACCVHWFYQNIIWHKKNCMKTLTRSPVVDTFATFEGERTAVKLNLRLEFVATISSWTVSPLPPELRCFWTPDTDDCIDVGTCSELSGVLLLLKALFFSVTLLRGDGVTTSTVSSSTRLESSLELSSSLQLISIAISNHDQYTVQFINKICFESKQKDISYKIIIYEQRFSRTYQLAKWCQN